MEEAGLILTPKSMLLAILLLICLRCFVWQPVSFFLDLNSKEKMLSSL